MSCDELCCDVYCACHHKAAAAPAAPTRAAAPPGGSVYCACHAKGSRGPSGAHARRSSSRRLCVLRLPRERQPRPQRRPRAPQLLQEALCTAPATPKAAAAPAAPTRAAAPPGGSVYCACHAKGSQEAICTVSEWVSEWVCVCVSEWVSEGGREGVREGVSEWVNEWWVRRRRRRRRSGAPAGSKRKTRTPHSDVRNNDSRFKIGWYVERSVLKGMGGDGGSTFKLQNNDSTCQLCSYITGTALYFVESTRGYKLQE